MDMNIQFSGREKYPDWQQQPYRLSKREISNPMQVVSDLFDCYSLVELRELLREWFSACYRSESDSSADFLHVYDLMEKLVEASWVMNRQST